MTIKAEFYTKVYSREKYPNVVKFEVNVDEYWFVDDKGFTYNLHKNEVQYLVIINDKENV